MGIVLDHEFDLDLDLEIDIDIEVAQNEVHLTDDYIGLFHSESLDNSFLTVDSFEETNTAIDAEYVPFEFDMTIKLSNKTMLHKRQIVSFLDYLGTVGGFYDAIWLTISFFMGTFSSLMFMRAITNNHPYSRKSKS